ncbi:MAG: 16S rRNA (cytosine(1402)-N(4))-methyltransferase RsmH [Sedimentisphaerales bacterium]|nr:16S rRNA (cytosine(1402)-N(4))-methyltransferase RsmH [Sedimentisphaerales bacterium]
MCTPSEDSAGARHVPVLVREVSQFLAPPKAGIVVDLTIGQGGHGLALGAQLGPEGILVGIDLDQKALESAATSLAGLQCKVILLMGNYASIGQILRSAGLECVDVMLADLGFCSAQVFDQDMGLSFQTDAPLDMRFDRSIRTTAADIVNNADEQALADLIYQYGQDRLARRIARLIVERRQIKPITTTKQLAEIVCSAYRGRSRIHPATRTFQALRIAVNHELDNLKALLEQAPSLLRKGGRIGVISFHSLEDRIVKYDFKAKAEAGLYKILTTKPVRPGPTEVSINRRARSAKLRVAERI